jgi:hypothetical protein
MSLMTSATSQVQGITFTHMLTLTLIGSELFRLGRTVPLAAGVVDAGVVGVDFGPGVEGPGLPLAFPSPDVCSNAVSLNPPPPRPLPLGLPRPLLTKLLFADVGVSGAGLVGTGVI